jgi:hypothetical protein
MTAADGAPTHAPEDHTVQYALLIYGPEPQGEPDSQATSALMAEYEVFNQHLRDRGAYAAGEALWPTNTASSVRVRDGQTLTTDGPFAETKEALGGFYVVEAADLDEAIAYAARIPGARTGTVEIRPVVDFSAMPG